jgi:hypothetical protein
MAWTKSRDLAYTSPSLMKETDEQSLLRSTFQRQQEKSMRRKQELNRRVNFFGIQPRDNQVMLQGRCFEVVMVGEHRSKLGKCRLDPPVRTIADRCDNDMPSSLSSKIRKGTRNKETE